MDQQADATAPPDNEREGTWRTLRALLPHVWRFRARVLVAFAFLVAAKLALVGVSLLLARLVDELNLVPRPAVVPLLLLAAYGVLRLGSTLGTSEQVPPRRVAAVRVRNKADAAERGHSTVKAFNAVAGAHGSNP